MDRVLLPFALAVVSLTACGSPPSDTTSPPTPAPVATDGTGRGGDPSGAPGPHAEPGSAGDAGPGSASDAGPEPSAPELPHDSGSSPAPDGATEPPPTPLPPDACDVVFAGKKPVAIATSYDGVLGGALGQIGDKLFFRATSLTGVKTDAISIVPKTGGTPSVLRYAKWIGDVVTNGTTIVYAAPPSTIARTDLAGSFPAYYSGSPLGMAIDADAFYWTERGAKADGSDGKWYRLSTSAAPSAMRQELAYGPVTSALAVDGSGLYVVSYGGPPLAPPTAWIGRIDKTGKGEPTGLATLGDVEKFEIAIDAANVVVLADGKSPVIGASSKSTGGMRRLAEPVPGAEPHALRIDSGYAWWLEDQKLRRVSIAGGSPAETVWAGACRPNALVIDATSVYFLTAGDPSSYTVAKVWRLPKP